ncbi:MAG: HWE histidine kinase domain-containing protein [Micropepsaceae bacterium]
MTEIADKIEEQKDAEAKVDSFRKNLGPFVIAAEVTRMAMVFTDAREPTHPLVFANDSFLKLTGYDREDVLGRPFNSLIAPGVSPDTLARIQEAFDGTRDVEPEVHYKRKDGSAFWVSVFITKVHDKNGVVVQHFISLVDLTRYMKEQAHSKMLIDELNHRVKNTLATVQSIAAQALRGASNPEMAREAIESRLFALSCSHDLLTRESWEGAGLFDLVTEALKPFAASSELARRLDISGDNIRVSPKTALALGIALHELATNAAKYGAFSNQSGSIAIKWSLGAHSGEQRLILHWQEKGGPPVVPPTRKGFGSRVLIRGLAHELDAKVELDYAAQGLSCTIDVPLPASAPNE